MALLVPQDPCFHTEFYFCVNFIQILGDYANEPSRRDQNHPYVCALLKKPSSQVCKGWARLPWMRTVGWGAKLGLVYPG